MGLWDGYRKQTNPPIFIAGTVFWILASAAIGALAIEGGTKTGSRVILSLGFALFAIASYVGYRRTKRTP